MKTENQKIKSWKEMTKVEKTRNVWCLTVIGLAIIIFVIYFISGIININSEDKKLTIAGLDPYLSYLALEQMEFTTKTNYDAEYGASWDCTRNDFGISYAVSFFAPSLSAKYVQSVRLTIMVEPGIENISKGLWMMKELSGVKYDTCNYQFASQWVEENYNNDGATTLIGDADYTINAPSAYVRMLTIQKHIE